VDHNATQLNRYNTTPTQWIATQRNSTDTTQHRHNGSQPNATQPNKTDTTQHNGSQHNATQHNIMDYNTTQRNATQQNSPQHNKTGNKNHAHMLNKPVEVTPSSTKNSTEQNGQKMLQVYVCPPLNLAIANGLSILGFESLMLLLYLEQDRVLSLLGGQLSSQSLISLHV